MDTKFAGWWLSMKGLLPINLPVDHVVWWGHATYKSNRNIFTTTVPMTIRLGRMVTYLEGLLLIELLNSLLTWSCKITWQTKIIISLLPQCIRPSKLYLASVELILISHIYFLIITCLFVLQFAIVFEASVFLCFSVIFF